MNTYAILLLAGILGGYASDLYAVVDSKPVVDESAASSEKEYPGMEKFAANVRRLNQGGKDVYLVLGDKGRPVFNSVIVSQDEYDRASSQLRATYALTRGIHRFPEQQWAFLDQEAGEYADDSDDSEYYERAVLGGDIYDGAMWSQLKKSLSNTFLYIVDDFNLLANGQCFIGISNSNSLKERLDGIWHILKPGGVLVTQLCSQGNQLTLAEAQDLCNNKFDVYMTDDIFLSVHCGYMAQPYIRAAGLDPYYYCVRYWVNHVDDKKLKDQLSDKEKEILKSLEKKRARGMDGESLYYSSERIVGNMAELIRKMAPTWKVDTLLKSVEEFEKVSAEFLFNYPNNVIKERKLNEYLSWCLRGGGSFWGTYLIFRKK
ncbi:MAG: hypothetical protein LBJ71_03395 [Holosporaceae bacterium]|nr:hypothetical protein [Holosporaceae bacterium]